MVARELSHSGNWLQLTFIHAPLFDKPPLGMWATAFFYKIFGVGEFSTRLFSALCGAGIVTITYFFGRRLFNRWIAFCGALVLLSSSHFLRVARFGVLDAPFLFFMMLSLYLFWLGRTNNRCLIFSGIALGLAVMTKSFTGILIFPIVWIYAWGSGRLEILRRPSYWMGLLAAALIVLPWNLYELFADHNSFLRDAIVKQLIGRSAGVLDGHSGNYYFYIKTLVNKYHPWILVGIFSAPLFLWKAFKDREEEIIFIAVWIFSVFGIVTMARTKLAWYIFPVYPALSLSVAYFFTKVFNEEKAIYAKILFLLTLAFHAGYSHIFRADYSRPLKHLAPLVQKTVPEGGLVYLYRYHEQPAGVFYLDRNVRYLESPAELENQAGANSGFYCLVRAEDIKELQPLFSKLGMVNAGASDGVAFLLIPPK